MDTRGLPVQTRARSVVLLLGVVLGLLLAGLAIPFVFGERLTTDVVASTGDALPVGPDAALPGAPGEDLAAAPGATVGPQVPGAAAAPGAAGAPGAPGSAVAPGGTETAPGSAPGQAAAPGQPAGSAGGAPLTATDRGVTAKTVKVGFTALDTGGLGRTGVGIGVTVAQQEGFWRAYAEDVNARGGLNGRKIEPVVVAYDPLSESSQRAACLRLTQDEKVFAVVGGFNFPVAVSCVVRENQTPLFSSYPSTSDEAFAQSGGRFVTLFPQASRMMAIAVAALDGAGKLKGRTIGILNQQANDPGARTSAALERAIEARGHTVKRRADLSADSGTSASQVPVTVSQFQRDGIDTVFVLAAVTTATAFVQQAEQQGYRPAYHMTDWANNNNDFAAQNMPASFDGTIATTHILGHGNKQPFGPENASAARCREIHDKRSGRRLAARGTAEYGATMQGCDAALVFEKAAQAAGPNLTRSSVSAAVPSLGSFPVANFGPGRYAPGKQDFSEQVRFHVYRSSCSCWQPSGGFFSPR